MDLGREIGWENSVLGKNLVITLNYLKADFYCRALGRGLVLSLYVKIEDKQVDCDLIIQYECKV